MFWRPFVLGLVSGVFIALLAVGWFPDVRVHFDVIDAVRRYRESTVATRFGMDNVGEPVLGRKLAVANPIVTRDDLFVSGINERILQDWFAEISQRLKIYVYPTCSDNQNCPSEQELWKQRWTKIDKYPRTYGASVLFPHLLLQSSTFTNDPSEADLFLIPQWEAVNVGQQFEKEFVEPLREAVNSKWFLRSGGLDHIFIYTSDDTFSCEARIPPDLRSKLTRVLALSYSARLDCWGKCFRDDQGFCCKNCYRQQEDIAVPSLVPSPRRDWRADNKSSTAGQDNIYRDHAICFSGSSYNCTRFMDYSERRLALDYFHDVVSDCRSLGTSGFFGLHAAGLGMWSARIYDYLRTGTIPIITSDGVILPFERFLDYRQFTVKFLSSSLFGNAWAKSQIERLVSQSNLSEDVAGRLSATATLAKYASSWLDWDSQDSFRHPFTLTLLELVCHTRHAVILGSACKRPTSVIAKQEYPFPMSRFRFVGFGCCSFDGLVSQNEGYVNVEDCRAICERKPGCISFTVFRPFPQKQGPSANSWMRGRCESPYHIYSCQTHYGSGRNFNTACDVLEKSTMCFRASETHVVSSLKSPWGLGSEASEPFEFDFAAAEGSEPIVDKAVPEKSAVGRRRGKS